MRDFIFTPELRLAVALVAIMFAASFLFSRCMGG